MEEKKLKTQSETQSRLSIVFAVFVLMAIAIIIRLVCIQFLSNGVKDNSEKMEKNIITRNTLYAHRGSILSSDGRPLATSIFRYGIYLDIASEACDSLELFKREADSLSKCLASYFRDKGEGKPASYYYDKLLSKYSERIEKELIGSDTVRAPRSKFGKIWDKLTGYDGHLREGDRIVPKYKIKRKHTRIHLFRDVDINEWDDISKFPLFNQSLGQITVKEQHDTREHPQGGLALRTIGRLEAESPYGIEYAYRDTLAGENGYEYIQNIAPRLYVKINNRSKFRSQVARDGCDIHTTLDIDIQDVADKALRTQMNAVNGIWGTSIVMETNTGNILALVNLDRDKNWNLFEGVNHAIRTRFEPGSTIKVATSIALLDGAGMSPNRIYDSGHGHAQFIGKHRIKVQDAGDDGGLIDLTTAFARSANVYFAKAVYDYFSTRPQDYVNILRSLHLNERLDLGLLVGANPTFREVNGKGWSAFSLIKLSYGYEIELTPLRIVTLYNSVANGGRMVAPRLITRIERDGDVVADYPTQILADSICSKKTLRTIQSFLEEVAASGTARGFFGEGVVPFKAAAKTGTAQYTQGASIHQRHYVGSMLTYFPVDNPKYTIYTAIQKRAGDGTPYYGAPVAGPVQQKIAKFLYGRCSTLSEDVEKRDDKFTPTEIKCGNTSRMNAIVSQFGNIPPVSSSEWSTEEVDTLGNRRIDLASDTVPNVCGMGLSDAIFILERLGLKVEFSGSGCVRTQSIQANSKLIKGEIIKLQLR